MSSCNTGGAFPLTPSGYTAVVSTVDQYTASTEEFVEFYDASAQLFATYNKQPSLVYLADSTRILRYYTTAANSCTRIEGQFDTLPNDQRPSFLHLKASTQMRLSSA